MMKNYSLENASTWKCRLICDEGINELTPHRVHHIEDRSRLYKDVTFFSHHVKEETEKNLLFFDSRMSTRISERRVFAKTFANIKNWFHSFLRLVEGVCRNTSSKPKYKIGRHNHCFYVKQCKDSDYFRLPGGGRLRTDVLGRDDS